MPELLQATPEFRDAVARFGQTMADCSRRVVEALQVYADNVARKAADGDVDAIVFLQECGLYANAAGQLEELDPDERCNSVIQSRTHPDD